MGIAFLIIILNFPSPESDYAILPLMTVGFLTAIPLWIGLIIVNLKKKLIDKWLKNRTKIKNLDNETCEENEELNKNKELEAISS